MANREIQVTPTKEQLSIEERIRCPVEGCGQEFLSSSRLLMHTMRRHEGRRLTSVAPGNGNRVFFCPVEQCVRSKGGKPFSRLGKLKQHYHAVHGSKEFECGRCGKKFGLKDMCQRHERECGQMFPCPVCGEEFRSRNALYQHAKRKGHREEKSHSSNKIHPIVIAPIIIKAVLPIPKLPLPRKLHSPLIATISSQTSQTITFRNCADAHNQPNNELASIELASETTHDPSEPLLSPVHQASQTQTVPCAEFGTQTAMLGSRVYPPTVGSCSQLKLDSPGSGGEELFLAELLPPECMEFGTQTLDSALEDIASLDFGVQTLLPSDTKDQSSQTLP